MNNERPDALELLDIARETLVEKVLPQLQGDARYQGLMVANAMAMAIRELRPDATDMSEPAQLLRGLYELDESTAEESPEQVLQRLGARFAKDLRSGELDGGPQFPVRRLLRGAIEQHLAVSNPRRLGVQSGAGVEKAPASSPGEGADAGRDAD